jgi:hypothetical protein
MTSVLLLWQYVGITCCFSLVILNFLIWQFTLTRQIDKFKLLSIISDKSNKICSLIRIPTIPLFWRLSFTYCLLLMFHEIQILFYHNLSFLFDIFLTRICLYSEDWLWIFVYNLLQHIKNDTDSTDVVENDYNLFTTSFICHIKLHLLNYSNIFQKFYDAKYFGRQCHFLTNFEILNFKSIFPFTLFIWR